MRIFNGSEPWKNKINFVDQNEVYLGYNLDDDCCAHGGWFMGDTADWQPPRKEKYDRLPKEPAGIKDMPEWYSIRNTSKNIRH